MAPSFHLSTRRRRLTWASKRLVVRADCS
jgi:hypothetical protein